MVRPVRPHAIDQVPSVPDLDDVAEYLRELVKERRRSHQYPPDMRAELSSEAALAARRDPLVVWHRRFVERCDHLQGVLDHLQRAIEVGQHRTSTSSRVPLGGLVHRVSCRVVHRQVESIFTQMGSALVAVDEALGEVRDVLSAVDVFTVLDQFEHRLSTLEDALAGRESAAG